MQLFSAKSLAIFFGLATIAFTVSTIVLAVQKAELQDELDEALDKLGETTTTTTVVTVATTTTVGPSTTTEDSGTDDPGQSTSSSVTTTPGGGDPTAPTPPTGPTTTTTTTVFPWPTVTVPDDPDPTPNTDFPIPNEIIYRLPTHARPWKYHIYLHPDFTTHTFEGTVSINIEIDKLTDVIALHSKNLDIFGISILQVSARMRIKVKDYYTDPTRELLIIEFDEVLQLYTPYTLSITFRGPLTGLTGLYASSYTDQNGNAK